LASTSIGVHRRTLHIVLILRSLYIFSFFLH